MRSWLAASVGAILLVLYPPCLALVQHARAADEHAKEEHKAEPGKTAHGDEKEHANDPFKGSLDLTIWSIAVFLVLLAVLYKMAWGPIIDALDKREKSIAKAMEDAQKAQADAQQLRAQLQEELAQNARQVHDMMDAARRDAERMIEELKASARADIQADRERLRREIQMATDQALAEIWKQTSQLAVMVSAKTIRRHLSEEDHRQLVEEALGELQKAASGESFTG